MLMGVAISVVILSMKRISILRLKHQPICLIEKTNRTLNEKNLNSEIETECLAKEIWHDGLLSMKRISILRLKLR